MEQDIFKELLNNPLAGGSTIAGALLGLLYVVYKVYLSLKSDSSTSDAISMSLNSQGQVISILREEVARLAVQVKELQVDAATHDSERQRLIQQLAKAEQALQECVKARDASQSGGNHGEK